MSLSVRTAWSPLRAIYDVLPGASTNTVANLFGIATPDHAPIFAGIAPAAGLRGPRCVHRGLLRVPGHRDPAARLPLTPSL